MMGKPDIMNNKGSITMESVKSAFAGALIMVGAAFHLAAPATAQPGPLTYNVYADPAILPVYEAVFKAMEKTYEGSPYDVKKGLPAGYYPQIYIATPALRADGGVFGIGKPIEDGDGPNPLYCKAWGFCPHYIVEKTDSGTKVLAIIDAAKIDVDDKVENGMYRLKVYKERDSDTFDFYTYSKDTGGYVPVLIPSPKPTVDQQTLQKK